MTLQLYLKLGMKLVRVRRVLSFTQKKFLAPYIDFCTSKRANSKTEFEKRLWKLCVNSCFGKFIESVRKYRKCVMVSSPKYLSRLIQSPLFESVKGLNSGLLLVMMKYEELYLNKPIAIGFTILERSKDFMYEAFYTKIKPQFECCEVIFSDTDSLCMEVHTSRSDQQQTNSQPLQKIAGMMDFSNYPPSHSLYNSSRQNKLFFFKDEMRGERLEKFVGLRAKCYSIVSTVGSATTKLKGVTKAYRKGFTFDKHLSCLKHLRQINVTQYHLRAKSHKVFFQRATRVALSSYDCNRFVLPCGVHTLPYGSSLPRSACVYCKQYILALK